MKKLILLAGVASLAACGGAEAPAETEAPAEVATGPEAGLYEVTTAEGQVARTQMNADGTYSDIVDGEASGTGKWTWADGKTCFTSDEEGSEESCWTDGDTAEDGSWTATGPNGETVTVRPVEEEAEAEPAA